MPNRHPERFGFRASLPPQEKILFALSHAQSPTSAPLDFGSVRLWPPFNDVVPYASSYDD